MRRSLSPPRWLELFFPQLTGLREYPVYLRLSGRRFARNRRLLAPPEELRLNGASPLGAIGCFPWALAAFPPLIPFAILIAVSRLFGGGSGNAVSRFIRNGAREPWGAELMMTGYPPEETDKALFASTLERGVRWMAAIAILAGPACIAGIDLHFMLLWGTPMTAASRRELIALAAGAAPYLFVEGVLFLMLRLAGWIDDARLSFNRPVGSTFARALYEPYLVGALHLGPLLGLIVALAASARLGFAQTPLLFHALAMIALAVYAICIIAVARSMLAGGLGQATRTMGAIIRCGGNDRP